MRVENAGISVSVGVSEMRVENGPEECAWRMKNINLVVFVQVVFVK